MAICIDGAARAIWDNHYANDPDVITVKLTLGYKAYDRALTDASSLRVLDQMDGLSKTQEQQRVQFTNQMDRLQDKTAELIPIINRVTQASVTAVQSNILPAVDSVVKSCTERILDELAAKAEVRGVQAKLTYKGSVFEQEIAERLSVNPAINSATLIRERDGSNKQGGDILVTDLSGNTCVIETKNKQNIDVADLAKFVKDADSWDGPPALFAFLVKGGIGSSRKLQIKPLFEVTPSGRTLMWFRGDEDSFLQQLPVVMGIYSLFAKGQSEDSQQDETIVLQKILKRASESFQCELRAIKVDITDHELVQAAAVKKIKALKKREISLLEMTSTLKSHEVEMSEAEVPAKQRRLN